MSEVNKKVGDYTITRLIGSGNFGDVSEVKDDEENKYAMKMILKNRTIYAPSIDEQSSVVAEVYILSKLDHMFILKYIDDFKDEDSKRWCIVTELCKEDLKQRIKQKIANKQTFEEDQILDWFAMLASALNYLHDKNVLHRDIKPENVLISFNNLLKLSDFGAGKFLVDPTTRTTCGTLEYMAPEIFKRSPYDTQCDVWSLGVLIYELCCLSTDYNKSDRKTPNSYSKDLQQGVLAMLEPEPEKRHSAKNVFEMSFLQEKINAVRTLANSIVPINATPKPPTPPKVMLTTGKSTTDSGYESCQQAASTSTSEVSQNLNWFLTGINSEATFIARDEHKVWGLTYSQNSGIIYLTIAVKVSGMKYDEKNSKFITLFTQSFDHTINSTIWSLALAPIDTNGADQVYISVGLNEQTKNIYRLSGKELERGISLTDTDYIKDKCEFWVLASNTAEDILLIHPRLTSVIYIHRKEQKHTKVDLQSPLVLRFFRIEFTGQLLILGEVSGDLLHFYDLLVTEKDASLKCGRIKNVIETEEGFFTTCRQDEKLHLFTAKFHRKKKNQSYITEFFENKLNLSGSDSSVVKTFETLKVPERMWPLCRINTSTSCPVLIGINVNRELRALELEKGRNRMKYQPEKEQKQRPRKPKRPQSMRWSLRVSKKKHAASRIFFPM